MRNLLVFELKRLKGKKIIYILPVILIAIGFSGILLGNVYGNDGNTKILLLNVYNAYSQFAFLFLSFIFISVISEDFSKGNYNFFKQIGFSLTKCITIKSLILYVISVLVSNIFVVIYSLLINISDWNFVGKVILSIDLGMLFILLLSIILSIVLKKTMTATVGSFILYIAFDFLNLICYGLTNPCDANSLSCVTLGQLAGLPLTHDTLSMISLNYEMHSLLFITIPNLVYCALLTIAILFLIKKEEKR